MMSCTVYTFSSLCCHALSVPSLHSAVMHCLNLFFTPFFTLYLLFTLFFFFFTLYLLFTLCCCFFFYTVPSFHSGFIHFLFHFGVIHCLYLLFTLSTVSTFFAMNHTVLHNGVTRCRGLPHSKVTRWTATSARPAPCHAAGQRHPCSRCSTVACRSCCWGWRTTARLAVWPCASARAALSATWPPNGHLVRGLGDRTFFFLFFLFFCFFFFFFFFTKGVGERLRWVGHLAG